MKKDNIEIKEPFVKLGEVITIHGDVAEIYVLPKDYKDDHRLKALKEKFMAKGLK